MSPSFNELVEWLKTLEEGEPLPKVATLPRPAAYPMPAWAQSAAPQIFAAPQSVPQDADQSGVPDTEGLSSQEGVSAQTGAPPVTESAASKPAVIPADNLLHPFLSGFSHDQLAQGIVIAEILGKPLALRHGAQPRFGRRYR
jgi:hypothetical protein